MNKIIVTKDIVLRDYLKLKKGLTKYYAQNKIEDFMESLKIVGRLMYNFNFFYKDDEIEELIKECSKKIDVKIKNQDLKKIIFYDYFSIDNRGLTEQYLDALMNLGYEILYISLQKNTSKMKNIIEKISNYKKSEIYVVKNSFKFEACTEIKEKVEEFGATKVFIHTSPWDSVGIVTWSAFENKLERYFINLTDHTFWLGKSSADYFIEFRSYGKNISIDYRGIKEDKLIILPYYPIQNQTQEFQGFDFEYKSKKLIFSGGSLYKIYGSKIYFEIVKYILDNHEDTIILYLGNGDERPLQNFIKENNFKNRFYFKNERRDINEIFKRCYFYLGTFPVCGGLMSQFAGANNKLPVAYTSKDLPINLIEELFINAENKTFTYTDIKEIKKEISKLLLNKNYLDEKTINLSKLVISKLEFTEQLKTLINDKKTRFKFKAYEIDINKFSELYLQQENDFLNQYEQNFLTKNIKIAFKFRKYFLQAIVKRILLKLK